MKDVNWSELKYKIRRKWHDITLPFTLTWEFLVRLVNYLPIIWRDRDYDYIFILKMLKFKLERTRKHIVEHNIIADAARTGRRIRVAELLISRIIDDNYLDDTEFDNKWGNYKDTKEFGFTREKVKTKEDLEAFRKELNERTKKSNYLQNQDYEYLFKYLNKHIRTWWD